MPQDGAIGAGEGWAIMASDKLFSLVLWSVLPRDPLRSHGISGMTGVLQGLHRRRTELPSGAYRDGARAGSASQGAKVGCTFTFEGTGSSPSNHHMLLEVPASICCVHSPKRFSIVTVTVL